MRLALCRYSDLYFMRLQTLKPQVAAVAAQKWKSNGAAHIDRILEIPTGQKCFVVGTIYKEMVLKPNILDEFTNKDAAPADALRRNYVDEKDYAIVEDDSGRITLNLSSPGVPSCAELVTGEDGVFVVEEVCYAGLADQPAAAPAAEEGSLLLVSGLQLGDPATVPARSCCLTRSCAPCTTPFLLLFDTFLSAMH